MSLNYAFVLYIILLIKESLVFPVCAGTPCFSEYNSSEWHGSPEARKDHSCVVEELSRPEKNSWTKAGSALPLISEGCFSWMLETLHFPIQTLAVLLPLHLSEGLSHA